MINIMYVNVYVGTHVMSCMMYQGMYYVYMYVMYMLYDVCICHVMHIVCVCCGVLWCEVWCVHM